MSEDVSLFKTRWFKLAITVPLVIAALYACLLGYDAGLTRDFSIKGLLFAFNFFTPSIVISSLTFPLVALVASNHNSKLVVTQLRKTDEQIKLQKAQNNFANYYLHVEKFSQHVELSNAIPKGFVSTKKLHDVFYPKAKEGNFSINNPLLWFAALELNLYHSKLSRLSRHFKFDYSPLQYLFNDNLNTAFIDTRERSNCNSDEIIDLRKEAHDLIERSNLFVCFMANAIYQDKPICSDIKITNKIMQNYSMAISSVFEFEGDIKTSGKLKSLGEFDSLLEFLFQKHSFIFRYILTKENNTDLMEMEFKEFELSCMKHSTESPLLV